jgi:hypothetical protein
LLKLVIRFVSQPSPAKWLQSANPDAQTSWHVPFTHEAEVAFAPAMQT